MATARTAEYIDVTEMAGALISQEQLQRMHDRYVWAGAYADGKDVLEVACGSGQGLELLCRRARSVVAGDVSDEVLATPRRIYCDRVTLRRFDAQAMPFADDSFDVVILFEAIYYIEEVDRFFSEARRVLRPGGVLLIATANKDLFDFIPSPHSHEYLGAAELSQRLAAHGFSAALFGHTRVDEVSMRQRLLRPAKALASRLGVVPATARGKVWLKRFVFGKTVPMPDKIVEGMCVGKPPKPISPTEPDRRHKVILCAATVRSM